MISNSPILPSQKSIASFWGWFVVNAPSISTLLERGDAEEIAKRLGYNVRKLSDRIGWEVGPGRKAKFSFSIGLNGAIRNVDIAEAIVDKGPHLADWEFHIGRPPKIWNGRFELLTESGKNISIDSSKWLYVLTAFDHQSFFDISMIGDFSGMENDTRLRAAVIILQSELGERMMLERIDRIEFLESAAADIISRASRIADLKFHLAHLDENRRGKPRMG